MAKFCIDLDDTLMDCRWTDYTHFGEPFPGAKEFVEAIKNAGNKVIIHTCRTNADICDGNVAESAALVEDWLDKHGIPFDEIWTGVGKPVGWYYIDDRAIQCQPREYSNAYNQILKGLGIRR